MSGSYPDHRLKLFTLNSNPGLAEEIARFIGVDLGKCSVGRFSDGEVQINIEESIRGCDVFVIQSTSSPVNENYMELLIMIDALKRASARTINIVMPYYGYARQDRKARAREPITARRRRARGSDGFLTSEAETISLSRNLSRPDNK